jgi:predicted nuclease of predicted toxin-antitoxin system
MRFLVDECTGSKVARWLRDRGYEVFSVYDEARGISDDEVLQKALNENWILITNDKDFGDKIFREGNLHRGIIFLRLENERATNKINKLQLLLENYADRLPEQFVVVTENKVRFASP